jgi:TRAP-type C4-dicarboxylate transport system permease small subunit
MKGVMDWIERAERYLLITCFAVMMAVTGVGVFFRYVIGQSIPWEEEVALFCFVWMTLVGASACARNARHIKIDTFVLLLPSWCHVYLEALINLIVTVFLLYLLVLGVRLVVLDWAAITSALRWKMSYISLSIVVGTACMLTHFVPRTIADVALIFKGKNG